MAFKPSLRRTRPPEDLELNVTPIMNLMVVLIPLLLSAAKFTEFALLEYLPPAEPGEAAEEAAVPPEEESAGAAALNLLINIVQSGVQVSLFESVEAGPNFYEIPILPTGGHNWAALKDSIWSIKRSIVGDAVGVDSVLNQRRGQWESFSTYQYRDGREVSITAVGDTPFQTIVETMDACRFYDHDGERSEMFPITVLKQFQ